MSHSLNPGFEPGNRWAVCDRCGSDFRISEMKDTWDGLLVCKNDWEPRHPQDLLRPIVDNIAPTGPIRPEQPDIFIPVTVLEEPLPSGNNNNNLTPLPPPVSAFSSGFDSGFS